MSSKYLNFNLCNISNLGVGETGPFMTTMLNDLYKHMPEDLLKR